jgi:hypothetical protein
VLTAVALVEEAERPRSEVVNVDEVIPREPVIERLPRG